MYTLHNINYILWVMIMRPLIPYFLLTIPKASQNYYLLNESSSSLHGRGG